LIIIFYIQIFFDKNKFHFIFSQKVSNRFRSATSNANNFLARYIPANRANLLFNRESMISLSDRFANRCCLSSETHIPSLSFSTNILAFIRCLLAFCMDELANRSERGMYIHTYDNRTTKVNALMMSADMCMNNVISVCAWYESIGSWLVLLLGYITYWSTFKCLY